MRVLAHAHGFPPVHVAGAERMLQVILEWLVKRGHTCHVAARDLAVAGTFNGVTVSLHQYPSSALPLYHQADVVITHLDLTKNVCRIARQAGKPVIHLVHNDKQLRHHKVRPHECALAVFNSHWVARKTGWAGNQMVLYPPIDFDTVRTSPGQRVTLINLLKAKGGDIFWEIAKARPDRLFLAVKGAYGQQVIPGEIPSNVKLIEKQTDIREVYRQTGILLMPSTYESFGRTAIEAMSNGIPVIAARTPGLLESCESAPMWIEDRDDVGSWAAAIGSLSGLRYTWYARKARIQAEKFDNTIGLEQLEAEMEALCSTAALAN